MSADKPKLEFFDDIKSQLVLILAGIVSLATVIPAFLNSTAEMLGWDNIRYGYYLFVFLYFVTPYLFYLIYCSIHDDVGYLELLPSKWLVKLKKWKHYKTAFEIAIPLLALGYLVWPQCPFEEIASIVLYFSAVICAIYFGVFYWKQGGVYTEFRIIACTIILAFAFFLGNMLKQITIYSSEAQNKAFEAYETRNALKKDFINVLDNMRREAYKCRMQVAIKKPSLETTPLKGDGCNTCGISAVYNIIHKIDTAKSLTPAFLKTETIVLKKAVNRVLKYDQRFVDGEDGLLYQVDVIYQASVFLSDYGLSVQRKQMTAVNSDWAKLLQNLQFKSMIWFQFLILLGLCLWLKMQIRLRSPDLIEIEEETLKKTDNISQVKSLILLLFVLTIPWLRHIDASDIELERPFLNISLSGLMDGTTRPPAPAVCTGCCEKCKPDTTRTIGIPFFIHTVDTVTKERRDTIWYPYSVFIGGVIDSPYRYKRDPILEVFMRKLDTLKDSVKVLNRSVNAVRRNVGGIQSDVKTNQDLIRKQAKRTIGNPADRKGF